MALLRLLTGLAFCLLLAVGCRRTGTTPVAGENAGQPAREVIAGEEARREPWIERPPGEWPQIVLTNDATFEGHTPHKGASSFLVRGPDDRILLATARHLLGGSGGVRPEVAMPDFDRVLVTWKAHPRTLPERFASVERAELACFDMAFFSLKPTPAGLPGAPLRLRKRPIGVGEKIFLVGCPYAEPGCRQNVYAGKVTHIRHGVSFDFSFDPPVNLRGFSGAPVLDGDGHAVGVFCRLGLEEKDGRHTSGNADLLAAAWEAGDSWVGVRLTREAAEAARKFIRDQKLPATTVVRAEVRDGQMKLDLDRETGPDDWRGQSHGLTVVANPTSLPRLRGSLIDYSPEGKGFYFLSPDYYRRR